MSDYTTIKHFSKEAKKAIRTWGTSFTVDLVKLQGLEYQVCHTCLMPLHESEFRILNSAKLARSCMICEDRKKKGLKPLTKKERKNAIRLGLRSSAAYNSKLKSKRKPRKKRKRGGGAATQAFQQKIKSMAGVVVAGDKKPEKNEKEA